MNKNRKQSIPPKWADRFFEWYCNPIMREEIQGDLYESFLDRVAHRPLWQAKGWYWLQVFLFINRRTLSREKYYSTRLNSIDMFRNYFKIGYRNILKNKLSTLINAFGMALAVGCCMVAFAFIYWWTNLDSFHSKREEIYVVQREMDVNGEKTIWNKVPQPLGAAIANDFPQIETTARVNYNRGVMQYEDKTFSEWVSFVDDSYHDLFDFEVKWGNKATFADPDGIILRKAVAEKYFGSKNPIGEELSIRFNIDGKEVIERFVVKGVLEKAPSNASFANNVLIPFQRQKTLQANSEDWKNLSNITFIQAKSPESIAIIKEAEDKYIPLIEKAHKNWNVAGLHFQSLTTVAQNGYKVQGNPFNTSHIIAIYMLFFVASSLLILVCFNYINITIASAATRLKEISVRKVMGSNRTQIIWQFLTENILICLLALIVGVALAHYLFLPWFNSFGDMEFSISFFDQPLIWLFTLALLLITAIGGAGYPALYISKFEPIAILKKEFKLGSKSRFRKFLIGGQLLLTIITIFCTFAFFLTAKSLKEKDWGYNQYDMAVIRLQKGEDYEKFKNDIQTNSNIVEITGSQQQLGKSIQPLKIQVEGREHDVQSLTVAENYLATLGVPLLEGRNFDERLETEGAHSIIVNETFQEKMEWANAVGQNVKINNQNYNVVGVVKDFHQEDFLVPIKPLVFQTSTSAAYRYVSIRTLPKTAAKVTKKLESNWKSIYPNVPYKFSFQDDVFNGYFYGFSQINGVLKGVAFLTIIIAIIGLFGLAMLLLARKMKEISIRKILGANIFQLSQLIHKEFFAPLLIATFIGLPLSLFLMQTVLAQIAPQATIGWLPFVLTIFSITAMLAISLIKHIYTAAVSNPSNFLRDD